MSEPTGPLEPTTDPPGTDADHLLPQGDWDRVVADAESYAEQTPAEQVDWREPEDLNGDGQSDRVAP